VAPSKRIFGGIQGEASKMHCWEEAWCLLCSWLQPQAVSGVVVERLAPPATTQSTRGDRAGPWATWAITKTKKRDPLAKRKCPQATIQLGGPLRVCGGGGGAPGEGHHAPEGKSGAIAALVAVALPWVVAPLGSSQLFGHLANTCKTKAKTQQTKSIFQKMMMKNLGIEEQLIYS